MHTHEHGNSGRKKMHGAGMQASLDWEENEDAETGSKISAMGVFTVALILLSMVGTGLYIWQVKVGKLQKDAMERALVEQSLKLPTKLESVVTGPDEQEMETVEKQAGKLNAIASVSAVEQMNERIKNFLEAETVEEKAKFVRESERVLPLMKQFYENNPYEPEGFRQVGDMRELAAGNSIIATVVRVKDFSDYPIAIEMNDGEWFVDWESWVGYCELSIDELREKKPTSEVLVRVMLSTESYYNYDFNDDGKWTSYRLRFKDSFEDLWGYVKMGSAEEAAIVDQFKDQQEKAMIMKIKYPENPRNDDQVLISSVVGDGWLLNTDKDQKTEK